MKSRIENTWVFDDNGVMHIVPKELPNYCGIETIGVVWHGEWSDPEIEYKGKRCNVYDMEDTMYGYYRDEYPNDGENNFAKYMKDNESEVIELCEHILFGD